ncbi:hypothetical protein E1B28_010966 [Marasmius oreades]|uniref:CDP-diacylglycerol--glycerol-3-phosphate 3-phosphatidyltransferase n=1 Tax=Marasmius oreades TaxID=181124 RepID=A0A9P7UPG8_9AGAR|nr:uncharacterized protein E1B28_010966 [Marasmius oreades]KAG7089268.1 hypothetical protein E1B28_010966 [Marasmius oreades]
MPLTRTFTQLYHELCRSQPLFTVSPRDVKILKRPDEFYSQLLTMIRGAERRIFLSSLYIGSSESELIDVLTDSLRKRHVLNLYLQLDLNRSTRPGASSTAKILLPLLEEFPNRVHASFFRSPNLRGIMAKLVPPRFNEGWGTWHAKIYGADDGVMISGANLNKSYFTDRQDRYLHFSNQPTLSQYCFDFMKTVSGFSYQLCPTDVKNSKSELDLGPYSFTHKDGYTMFWPDFRTHPHKIHRKAEEALSAFQRTYCESTQDVTKSRQEDPEKMASELIEAESSVALVPIIQAGQFNIKEEEKTFECLFRHVNAYGMQPDTREDDNNLQNRPLIDLTSGYFGLYERYQRLILGSTNVDVRVIAASPKANGFYGSKGISGRIPDGYTLFEQRFMAAVKRAGRLWTTTTRKGVQLQEWWKDGCTYHGKGLWLYPTRNSAPVLTLFGSTNLNSRSAHIDTELSFLMILPSDTQLSERSTATSNSNSISRLSTDLAAEAANIRQDAGEWKGGERRIPLLTKLIVALVGGML